MARKLAIIGFVALSAALSLLSSNLSSASDATQATRGQPLSALTTPLSLKAGDIDPAFGQAGTIVTDFGSGSSSDARAVAIQADGKIVAVGATNVFPGGFALVRYNPNGSLDSGFGTGGKVQTDFGGEEAASAVAIQPDGKIVVAGEAVVPGSGSFFDFALARYNRDGSLDPTFGSGGKVSTNLRYIDEARGVAIQADGKIVAVGDSRTVVPRDYDFAVVRYNSNGSLDASFGGVGYVTTSFTSLGLDLAEAVLLQPDGKIVAAGVADASSPSTQDLALARYNPDGSLDGSFGVAGKVQTRDPRAAGAWSVAIQPDNKLAVAGGIVARYNADGSLDATFGANGKVSLAGASGARTVLVQPERKLVVAGTFSAPTSNDFLVARLQADGSMDSSFGAAGQAHTDFASNHDEVTAAALQRDGRIIVAGDTRPVDPAGPVSFALARYLTSAPVTCKVPQVRGKKLSAARSAIIKAHCRVGRVARKASKRAKAGRVISQSPKARTTLPNLGKVNLIVSRGRR